MEWDQGFRPEPGPGLCGSDREIFERVWRRVMPEDRYDSPVMLLGEEAPCPAPAVPAEAPPASPMPCPTLPPPLPGVSICANPGPMEPSGGNVPCLGTASAVHGAELQSFILHELMDARTYQAMARRADRSAARTLSGISADERRHAKRLSTAYFLISGVRYWPVEQAVVSLDLPLAALLRRRFWEEQEGEAAYRAAAAATADPCLQELYIELAEDENSHAWLLRGILEAM